MSVVNLGEFNNSWYQPGRSRLIQGLWFFIGLPILRSAWMPSSRLRCIVLRLFGAHVGRNVVIKPGVRVKHPWLLTVGDQSWIGEDCWIDNLAEVVVGSNVCLSQGVYLCTGNHDWSDPAFGLQVRPITVHNGAWVAARAILSPGVTIGEHAVIAIGTVVTHSVDSSQVVGGNPAALISRRIVRPAETCGTPLPRDLPQHP